jgi:large subunit ribosomal protein L28
MPMRKQCMLLGKRANSGMNVSFSHRRTHKIQEVNLQWKRVFWTEGNTYVKLRLSTKAIKTLKSKVGTLAIKINSLCICWKCRAMSILSMLANGSFFSLLRGGLINYEPFQRFQPSGALTHPIFEGVKSSRCWQT